MGAAGSCSKGAEEPSPPPAPDSIRAVQLDCGALFINGGRALASAGGRDPVAAALDQGGAVYVPAVRPAPAAPDGGYTHDGYGSDGTGSGTPGDQVLTYTAPHMVTPRPLVDSITSVPAPVVHVVQSSQPSGDVYFLESPPV